MNLKLTYRDKVIFIVIIVILVLVAGFFLLIKPKFEDVQSAKDTLAAKQQEKADIDAKIGTLPDLIQSIKDVAQEVGEKQEIFLEEGHPYVNETYIRDILKSQNVTVVSMDTAYTTASEINWYSIEKQHILAYDNKINSDLYNELPQEVYDLYNGVEAPVYPGSIIGVTTMTVTFESDLQLTKMYNVLDKIADDEKAIILNSIDTGDMSESEQTVRECTANLTLYSIFPLNVEKVMEETPDVAPIEQAADQAAETTAAE